MESLFRFALVRPAVEPSDEAPSVDLTQNSQLQRDLAEARGNAPRPGPNETAAMKAVARAHAAGGAFVPDVESLAQGARYPAFTASLDQLENNNAVDNAAVAAEVQKHLGAGPAAVIQTPAFNDDVSRLRDSMMTIKLLPEEHIRPLHRLSRALRDLEVIRRTATDQTFPQTPNQLHRYRHRSIALPGAFGLSSVLKTDTDRGDDRGAGDDARRKQFEALLDRFRGLRAAVEELGSVRGEQLVSTPPQSSSRMLPPAGLRPMALFAQGLSKGLTAPQLHAFRPMTGFSTLEGFTHAQPATGEGSKAPTPAAASTAPPGPTTLTGSAGVAGASGTTDLTVTGVRTTFAGRPSLRPDALGDVGFRLTDAAGTVLSKGTRAVLEEFGLRVTAQPLDEIVEGLRVEMRSVTTSLDGFWGQPVQRSFKRFGKTMVMISTPINTAWTDIFVGKQPGFFPPAEPPDGRIPHSHGTIAPVGVADLIVVKQQLVRYEAVDVAHIENVLQGERKVREHRRRRETEQLSFLETEVTTSEERDLESTDRFEMVRESSETIREESSLKAGLTVSGKYGPFVEFSASAEGSLSRSKEQSTKTASNFSKEVTQRSATKITERILQRESLRVTTEVEDKNEHTLDNVAGDGHVRGVYQWVEKVYEAQMFNYGLRTMYDFMVPEPGAFLIETLRTAHASAIELAKPMAFTKSPNQITEYNYHTWVREYGATDVTPPPEIYINKSLDYSAGGGDDKVDYNHSAQVQIDEGYRAIQAYVGTVLNIWDDDWSVDLVVGHRTRRTEEGTGWVWSTSLDSERDSVAFGLNTLRVSDIAVAVEIKCQRTDHALDKWRHDTHAKLSNAYRARLAEYEEKLARLEADAGIEIEGMSPAANVQLMNDELKKNCISILTEQHYDLFDAIQTGANGLPQIDLFENEGEGPYVRFFEQAFEWEHLTWVAYPYFWGRKSQWTDRVAFEDADPLFNGFLKAGYCRVAVPVREGFEGAVDHFMTFGEPWMGGPLPTISSPLFLPIADELAERLDRPGDEVPEGDPWEVHLPTSLVRLRDDGSLPSWQKDQNGNWIPE